MIDFPALITQIEGAIDTHPELTRARSGNRGIEVASLTFKHGAWEARCPCRSRVARGPGSRLMHEAWGPGETPELAVAKLIEMLHITAESLR